MLKICSNVFQRGRAACRQWRVLVPVLMIVGALGAAAVAISAQAPQGGAPAAPEPKLSGGRPVFGGGPSPGPGLFQANCASCHTVDGMNMGGRVIPSVAALKAMTADAIYAALLNGKMAAQGASLSDGHKRAVAVFAAGRGFSEPDAGAAAKMTNQCSANAPLGDLAATASWNGWGPGTSNARFQTAAAAGLKAADVPKLKLKWSFGLPAGSSVIAQPTVAFGRVFLGSDSGYIYSVDAKSGCVYWSFKSDSGGKFAPAIGPVKTHAGTKYAIYFVTRSLTAYAIDAQDGKLLWKNRIVGGGPHGISGSSVLYDGRLYVPLTGTETVSGSSPNYECCKTRGGVAALNAETGEIIWNVDTIPEPLKQTGTQPNGKAIWGPSGASVWNAPTIDPKRKRIYVGTGNSFGPVAANTSDSILALSMDDGHVIWHHQEFKDDAFMLGCPDKNPNGGNCPAVIGQDWDFGGSSVILQTLPDGRDVLLAAGKGGVAIALDADGKLLWRTKLYDTTPPTADGLVLFGGAADGSRVYYPLQQVGGGVKALQLATGKIDWSATLNTDARGQFGAASAIPGVVFTGAWDGILRAVDTTNGKMIWSFNSRQSFKTVNGVGADGGSFGSAGPTIANGMVFAASGYPGMQQGYPGNVVLAFGVE